MFHKIQNSAIPVVLKKSLASRPFPVVDETAATLVKKYSQIKVQNEEVKGTIIINQVGY